MRPAPRCPICGAEVTLEASPHRPFCSSRCKLVDLDRWLSGDYRIPGPPVDPEDLARLPPEDPRSTE